MEYKLVKLNKLSGDKASIYTVYINKKQKTLFDIFISENKNIYLSELNDILKRLISIGQKSGAREQYFKLYEGKFGDKVCALYDRPDKKLRLYCIRYNETLIILGGGGPKSKRIHALQENEKLEKENRILKNLSIEINKKIEWGEINFSDDLKEFEGNMEF